METWELLGSVVGKHGSKLVADILGLSQSTINKWCQPHGGGRTGLISPLDRILQLVRLPGGLRLVRRICRARDGYFVPNPPAKNGAPPELLPATSDLMRELALMQAELAQAVKGGRMTPECAAEFRERWDTFKSDMEYYVKAGERGGWKNGNAKTVAAPNRLPLATLLMGIQICLSDTGLDTMLAL